jgi:predicted Fe-Mo cluster-binding NifX family protein
MESIHAVAKNEKARITMSGKVLITIWLDDVAPRFDLASEVLIATLDSGGAVEKRKTLVLPSVSAEDLCKLILSEDIEVVICGGIENEYYQYLGWKKVQVIDSVIGPFERALELAGSNSLEPGAILFDRDASEKG